MSFIFMGKYYSMIQTYHFVHPFTNWWTFGYFHFLAIMNNAAMNMYAQVSAYTCFLFLFCIYLWVGLLDHIATLCVRILGTASLFYKVGTPSHNPIINVWGSQFLHVLPNICFYLPVCTQNLRNIQTNERNSYFYKPLLCHVEHGALLYQLIHSLKNVYWANDMY